MTGIPTHSPHVRWAVAHLKIRVIIWLELSLLVMEAPGKFDSPEMLSEIANSGLRNSGYLSSSKSP